MGFGRTKMQNNNPIIQQVINTILEVFPTIEGVYIFGSTGTEFEKKESDVDIAILSDSPMTSIQVWNLSQKIAVAINKDVDLVDLHEVSTVFCFQIISTGKRVYCRDKNICDNFEMIAYSSYLRLNEERKEILDDIKNRGQIFNG